MPLSTSFEIVVSETAARWQDFYMNPGLNRETWALGRMLFLIANWRAMCQSKHQILCLIPSPPVPIMPRTNSKHCQTACGGWWLPQVGRLKEKKARWETPNPGRYGDLVTFYISSSPEGPPCYGCPIACLAGDWLFWTWRFKTHGVGIRQHISKGVH